MNRVCMYLRKSRADEEAEKRGEGETLGKHRKMLLKYANEKDINIIKIREEIVSGESLAHRPEMLELLKEVEQGMYDAVLCMDVDRLGRGNMQEQGIILETFKSSDTKIITPRKIYDLHDEFDEEYSEFEAFMARKELKIINRRLQRGRIRSIEDGNYISNVPPFGYMIHKTNKDRTLKPHPEQADVIKLIFELYTNGLGGSKIAHKLNSLGYKTYTGKDWSSASIISIVKNPVYVGKITWRKKEIKKSLDPNKRKDTRLRDKSEWLIVDGKHQPLVSKEIFEKSQEILSNKYHVPYQRESIIKNPLAGLIKCKKCGASMVLRPYPDKDDQIMCYNHCGNKSSKLKYVEESLIQSLNDWLKGYKAQWDKGRKNSQPDNDNIQVLKRKISYLEKEFSELGKQKERLHDLLERGVYSIDTYLERSQNLAGRFEDIRSNIENCKDELLLQFEQDKVKQDVIPKVQKVLDMYYSSDDPAKKNDLLKSILERAEYYKNKSQRNDQFTLVLYPKLPRQ
ncbi:recombinase family protein [Petroclostridium sp. X23]|uniref:recombinase family protein n=1 Tax=Petroclostridium sp. X23 TaxID=3045146 RepID=UPI0024AD0B60|nr:recombinase family protein [Petroclostridium sp. X23]WHH59344.1 recombinase family protein [Petroclostridium sp. X23]